MFLILEKGKAMEFQITIQGDSEGYVTFECPFCNSEFKLKASEYQDEEQPFEDLFCPYCGLTTERNQFLAQEVIEQAKAIAYNHMIEKLNGSLNTMAHSVNKSKSIIKMKFKPLRRATIKELKDRDTSEVEFGCYHCEHHVKVLYCSGAAKIFCPYCGVDI